MGHPPRLRRRGLRAQAPLGSRTDLGILDFDRGAKLAERPLSRCWPARAPRWSVRLVRTSSSNTHTVPAGSRSSGRRSSPTPPRSTAPASCPSSKRTLFHAGARPVYLIPTAEVALTNLHARRDPWTAPSCRCGTPRARRASARRRARLAVTPAASSVSTSSTKVEMVKFATPEDSDEPARASMVEEAEYLLQQLGLPYHIDEPVRRATWASRARQTYRHRGVAAQLQRLQGDPRAAPTAVTSRPAAPTSRYSDPVELQGHAPACTRSTAAACPAAAPWRPSSRTTRTPTAP